VPPAPSPTDRSRMATPEREQQHVAEPAEQPLSWSDPVAAGSAPIPGSTPRRGRWRALTRPRVAVPACAALSLVGMALPWFSTPAFDAGFGYQAPASTVNGFDAGMLVVAAVLLVLAGVLSLLPPRLAARLRFPAALATAGLTTLALLLTVPEWLTTFDRGFAPVGLLTVLSAAAACAVALVASVAAVRAWPPAAPEPVVPDPPAGEPADEPAGEEPAAPEQSPAEIAGAAAEQQPGSADDEQWADPRRRRGGSDGTPAPEARE